jgi:uncharacterized protein
MPSFLAPLLRGSSRFFQLQNARTGTVIATQVLTAFDSTSRNKGLLGRDGLPDGAALIIAPTNAIHTFFMKFPIDVAFVAKDGRVAKIVAALRPWRITAAWGAYAVIEFPDGALRRADTLKDDYFLIVPR